MNGKNKVDPFTALCALGCMLDPNFMEEMEAAKDKPVSEDRTQASAEGLKKTYDAFCEVGFSEEQAFDLLKTIIMKK